MILKFTIFQNSLLKVDKLEVKCNKKIANNSISYDNTDPEKTVFNVTQISIVNKTAVKVLQIVTISIPEDENDREYRKIIFKSSFDVCKFADIQSTYVARALLGNFQESADFEIKFFS